MDFDLMGIVQQYAVLPVATLCYLFGALLKRLEWVSDKYIPLAVLPLGIVGVLWSNAWAVTPDTLLAGACSAAMAVYAHQIGKQLTKGE